VAFLVTALLPTCLARIGFAPTDLTASTWDEFLKSNDKVMVDFFDPADPEWATNNNELQNAVRLARREGCEVPFAKVNVAQETALGRKYVPNGPFPQLMWFQHGEPTQYHRRLRKTDRIVDFALSLDRIPIAVVKDEPEARQVASRVIYAQLPKSSPMYRVLETVALKHMDTVSISFTDQSGMRIRFLQGGLDEVHDYSGPETFKDFDHWVRMRLTKSEDVPEPQVGDSVAVVGQTFEELVLRPDKDVLLLIYASWCGFSRQFMPTWEALARQTHHAPHLVVAKMDGDLNDTPYPEDFRWSAYPTVFFVPAGERAPVVFHGNRSIAGLLAFARKNSKIGLPAELDALDAGGAAGPDEWEL